MPGFPHGRGDPAWPPDLLGTQRRRGRIVSGLGVAWVKGPVFLVGLCYAVFPYVLGFADTDHDFAVHNLVVGCAICLLAIGFTVAPERVTGLTAALGVTGLWMAVAPWCVARCAPRRAVVGVVLGVLALFLGLLSSTRVRRANRLP